MARVWKRYRAACVAHLEGCRQCGAPIADRLAYCGKACRETFEANHFWSTASSRALSLARGDDGKPRCRECGKACGSLCGTGQREAEVNHIAPLNGKRPFFGCCHHQDNLEVLCHDCHVETTKAQRRQGLIGRPKTPRAAAAVDPVVRCPAGDLSTRDFLPLFDKQLNAIELARYA